MRNLKNKFLALALACSLLGFGAAQASIPLISGPQEASQLTSIINSLIIQINNAISLVNGGQVFSNSYMQNPLTLANVQTVTLASANTAGGFTFLTGLTGRTIYPVGLTVTALGGTAAAATGIVFECSSGNILMSATPGNFVSAVPMTFSSTAANAGLGFTGCASGDSVLVSHNGSSITGPTGFVINMPYTVQ